MAWHGVRTPFRGHILHVRMFCVAQPDGKGARTRARVHSFGIVCVCECSFSRSDLLIGVNNGFTLGNSKCCRVDCEQWRPTETDSCAHSMYFSVSWRPFSLIFMASKNAHRTYSNEDAHTRTPILSWNGARARISSAIRCIRSYRDREFVSVLCDCVSSQIYSHGSLDGDGLFAKHTRSHQTMTKTWRTKNATPSWAIDCCHRQLFSIRFTCRDLRWHRWLTR